MSKISFFNEQDKTCPVCTQEVKQEVLRSGRGRLDSSDIQRDLRQSYMPSKKFGVIYPLIYDILVCPNCWFAALEKDFQPKKFDYQQIKQFEEQRKQRGVVLLKSHKVDFKNYRTLSNGLVSYYLAIHCYHFFLDKSAVDFYKGLFSIRASWCAKDIAVAEDDKDFLYTYFYFRYLAALNYENYVSQAENGAFAGNIDYYGPDCSMDHGFRGLIYLSACLGDEFSELIRDEKNRYEFYTKLLRRLSKIFGIGKKSKNNPSIFLDMVYNLYEDIKIKAKKIHETNDMPMEEILDS